VTLDSSTASKLGPSSNNKPPSSGSHGARYELEADPEGGGFFASHPELPGCFAPGETADEAVQELDAAREVWSEVRLEDGLPIPESGRSPK